MPLCLSFLTACLLSTFRGPLSPKMAFADAPETISQTLSMGAENVPETVSVDEGTSDPDAPSDSGSGDSSSVATEGDSSDAEDVAAVDDETEVRRFDYEAPETIIYVGLGCCVGALLGVVFSDGWNRWGAVTADE